MLDTERYFYANTNQFYDQISRQKLSKNKLFQIAGENSNELFAIHFAFCPLNLPSHSLAAFRIKILICCSVAVVDFTCFPPLIYFIQSVRIKQALISWLKTYGIHKEEFDFVSNNNNNNNANGINNIDEDIDNNSNIQEPISLLYFKTPLTNTLLCM